MTKPKKYQQILDFIKKRIQTREYTVGSYLPSEHDICAQFKTTRTTVRRALDELLKEGFIEKEHGKGSRVLERGKSLGLPTIKGFAGSTNYEVKTLVTKEATITDWNPTIVFELTPLEKVSKCVYFQRVRYIDNKPTVLENNWYALDALEPIPSKKFVEGSFFKTLSRIHLIEIMGVEQELRAIKASQDVAENLGLKIGDPVLHISMRFRTSKSELNLYGDLYCNTSENPIRNRYFL